MATKKGQNCMELKFKHLKYLILFVIPTIIISSVLFILEPPSVTILLGFIALIIAACVTYILGIREALNDR